MIKVNQFKADFPVLRRKIGAKPLVYLDSAATSQMPQSVITAINDFNQNHRANVHRGVHTLSQEASEMYESARAKIGKFIGVEMTEEIIFTRNATESINLVAHTWGEENIGKGDKIVISMAEHHANFVTWQQLAKRKGARLEIIGVSKNGQLIIEGLEEKIKDAKIVAITHASNVTGVINPIKLICDLAHKHGALVLVDGAQAVPHLAVNVKELDADFYVFSSHKMLGPTGIGILWARKDILGSMAPYNFGGDMIKEVHVNESTWNDLPYKFEAGTPNIEGAIGLAAAIEYLKNIGMKNIRQHEQNLLKYAIAHFSKLGIEIIGPKTVELKTGVLSFNVSGAHPHDVAEILNTEGVAIRTGHHCAMPLHEFLGLQATCRASFYIYNDKSDVDRLVEGLKKVQDTFK